MKIKNLFIVFILVFLSFVLISCESDYTPEYRNRVYINDIKIFDQDLQEIATKRLFNEDVDSFLNSVDPQFDKLNFSVSYHYRECFTVNSGSYFYVEMSLRVPLPYELKEISLVIEEDSYYELKEYKPISMEKDNEYYDIKFCIDNILDKSFLCTFNNVIIQRGKAEVLNVHVTPEGKSLDYFFEGLAIRVGSSYDDFLVEVETLNNSLNTEFKLCELIPNVLKDIHENKDSCDYDKVTSYFYNKKIYNDSLKGKGQGPYYLYNPFVFYEMNDSFWTGDYFWDEAYKEDEYFLYVNKIYIGDYNIEILGLSLDNTIDEINSKLQSFGFSNDNEIENEDFIYYKYYSPNKAYSLDFVYSNQENKFVCCIIEYLVNYKNF